MEEGRIEGIQLPVYTRAVLIASVVLVGFLWRFTGLGKESIWLDEATSLIIARMDLRSEVAWAAADIHPPLYYLALHYWLPAGEMEFSIRALSAMLGVFAIVILYALGRELFGPQVGLLSALLLAWSPLHIWYSQEARMYAMLATMSLLSSYFLLLALRRNQARYWLGYIMASVLALYTHYFMLFVLLFQNLFVVYWLWQGKRTKALWYRWFLAELAIALLFLPWFPVFYRQVRTRGGGWVERALGRPSVYALVNTWLKFNIGPDGNLYPVPLRRLAYILFAASIIMAIVKLFRDRKAIDAKDGAANLYREGLLFCFSYCVIPLLTIWVFSQITPMLAIRYLSPFLPPYYIVVANGIHALRWGWLRVLIVLCLILILLVGNWNAWRIEQTDDWRGISTYVLMQAQPGDIVLFSPRWNAKPFNYYAQGRVAVSMDLPIPVTTEAAREVVADIAQRYARVWLIWQRGHYSDANGIVKWILDSQFQLAETLEFRNAMYVMLYDLKAIRTMGQ